MARAIGAARKRGFSLVELLAVVAILAVLGLAAVVSLRPAGGLCLDGAAQEVAEALRFARSEARRRGETLAFRVKPATTQISVYLPSASNPTSPSSNIPDPLTKRSYQTKLSDLPGCGRIVVQGSPGPFAFAGLAGERDAVAFDAQGDPHFFNSSNRYSLINGQVVLSLDGDSRSVAVSAIGRVSLP